MKKIGKLMIISTMLVIFGIIEVKASETGVPIGTVVSYTMTNIPNNYVEANGQAISRSEYKELFGLIGTTYGKGNGSTTFNVPDLRKRVVVGQSSENEFNILGKTGGEENHILTVEEMPSHTHTFTGAAAASGNNSSTPSAIFTGNSVTTSTGGEHTHSIPSLSGTAATAGLHNHYAIWSYDVKSAASGTTLTYNITDPVYKPTVGFKTSNSGNHTHTVTTTASTTGSNGIHNHTVTATGSVTLRDTTHTHNVTAKGTNSNMGGSKAHNNMQPYMVLKYMIKAK